jgi:hypothetical protein
VRRDKGWERWWSGGTGRSILGRLIFIINPRLLLLPFENDEQCIPVREERRGTDTQTDKQRDTQTESRQTDGRTDRQTDRETRRQKKDRLTDGQIDRKTESRQTEGQQTERHSDSKIDR